ncbi:MAG TPA: HAD family hydrolase [Anaerolineales bacterium]|nr:HAD family hydrolase [Anaerolineales bacterium]HNN11973.1 HAD family hydrolase [Anaerolineales bacterium]HNO31058.1 HAD family hydrolase [Anaerolineales bacterium]
MSSAHIKAVLFDLDGTLRHHIPTGDEVFLEYCKSIRLHFSAEDVIRAAHWEHFYFANSLEIQQDQKQFKMDERGFWVNFSKRRLVSLGLPQQQAIELAPSVSEYMEKNYKPEVYVPEELPFVLTQLKQAGYVMGVVSNRDEPFHEELKNLNLDAYFSFSLAGGEVRSFKPDRLIFEQALKRAGTLAHETMYVGDNYFADIKGALRAGLMPVLYDPGQLFPDAECAIIRSFDELPGLLK